MATGLTPTTTTAVDEDIFEAILSSLHAQIEVRHRTNYVGQKFVPRGEVVDVLRRSEKPLADLVTITARHSLSTVDRRTNEDNGKLLYDKLTCTIGNGCTAALLAIVLAVHKTHGFKPSTPAWQRFLKHCLEPHNPKSICDAKLPLKRAQIDLIFDEGHAELFYARQLVYSAPVLRRGHDETQDFTQLEAPLPYLKQDFTREGLHGKVFDTVIERSHIVDKDGWAPPSDLVYARKDIKRTDKKASVREWEIFQLIKKNRDKFDEHVMRISACCMFEDKVSLFMIKADHDLASYMSQTQRPQFRFDKQYIKMIANVASALEYFHNNVMDEKDNHVPIYHLDVKPENVLVILSSKEAPSDSPKLVLADFGVSKPKQVVQQRYHLLSLINPIKKEAPDGQMTTDSVLGKIAPCTPPEAIAKNQVDESADVWGFGCVLASYLAWLCGGPKGVKEFAEERKRHGNQLERFVAETADGTLILNPAVRSFLHDRCDRIAQMSTGTRYSLVYNQLIEGILLVEPLKRFKMPEVRQRLADIAKLEPAQFQSQYLATAQSPTSPMDEVSRVQSNESYSESRPMRASSDPQIPDTPARVMISEYADASTRGLEDAQLQKPQSPTATLPSVSDYRVAKYDAFPALMRGERVLATQSAASRDRSTISSYLSWSAVPMQEVQTIATVPNEAIVACLHRASATLFKVTGDLETSARISISYLGGKAVRTCTINDRYLCLVSDNPGSELMFYELSKLAAAPETLAFGDRRHRDGSTPFKAYSVSNPAAKLELVASRAVPYKDDEELIACLSPSDKLGKRTLTLLSLNLHKRGTTRMAGAIAQPSSTSQFISKFRSQDMNASFSEISSRMFFSSDSRHIIWIAMRRREDRDGVVAHVQTWRLGSKGSLAGSADYIIRPEENTSSQAETSLVDILVADSSAAILAAYRNSLEFMACGTKTVQVAILKDSQRPILAIATEDFVRFYLVIDRGPRSFDVIGVTRTTTEGPSTGLDTFYNRSETTIEWHSSSTLKQASWLRVQGRPSLLLIWDGESKRSMLLELGGV